MYKHRIYKGTYLKIYLGVSVSIFRVKVPAWRIVTISGTEFGATFSRSDVIVWVSKSRFTHPTIIKMARAARSFGRRTFYNSTCATLWTYGTNENTAVFDKVSSTDWAQKKICAGPLWIKLVLLPFTYSQKVHEANPAIPKHEPDLKSPAIV